MKYYQVQYFKWRDWEPYGEAGTRIHANKKFLDLVSQRHNTKDEEVSAARIVAVNLDLDMSWRISEVILYRDF